MGRLTVSRGAYGTVNRTFPLKDGGVVDYMPPARSTLTAGRGKSFFNSLSPLSEHNGLGSPQALRSTATYSNV